MTSTNWNNGVPTASVNAVFATDVNTAIVNQAGQNCNNLYLGYAAGYGNTLDIQSGALTAAASAYIGYQGIGTLSITAGGQLYSGNGYVGYSGSSSGNVTISGSGSTWTSSGGLYIGGSGSGSGGVGFVTVNSGGQLNVSGTLQLWNSNSNLIVSGGSVVAGSLQGTAGNIYIADPTGGVALTVGSSANSTFPEPSPTTRPPAH